MLFAQAQTAPQPDHPTESQVSVETEIQQLRAEIERHNKLYYDDARPDISDAAYDALFSRLRDLETDALMDVGSAVTTPAASPTARVGGRAGKVIHSEPMRSIENTYTEEGVLEFEAGLRAELGDDVWLQYCLELKFDGLAIRLLYQDGVFRQAVTRGNGEAGEDVTHRVSGISTVPKVLPREVLQQYGAAALGEFEVRGEVMLLKAGLDSINIEQERQGEKPYVTCRNAAAGLLRAKGPLPDNLSGQMMFAAYALPESTRSRMAGPQVPQTQFGTLAFLRDLGFNVSRNVVVVPDMAAAQRAFEEIGRNRAQLPFDIDGAVVKLNDLNLARELGATSRAPRSMLAWKFNEQEAWTRVLGIDVQVGRTSAVTPVARLSPVVVGGVEVTNSTLHNADEVARLDVRVGDMVLLRRNGDVIPGIVGVDVSQRPADAEPWAMPACGR